MVTIEKLQEKRTPKDLMVFVSETFESIKSDPEKRREARLRKRGGYKELIEEVYPLGIFCGIKYGEMQVMCSPVIGSQGYDAVVESDDGCLIEKIEITWPVDGQKIHYQAMQLNEAGYTEPEIVSDGYAELREEAIKSILDVGRSKGLKGYSQAEGSSLVFVLQTEPFFGMDGLEHQADIDRLVHDLSVMEFNVESVYLLLLPDENLIKIK